MECKKSIAKALLLTVFFLFCGGFIASVVVSDHAEAERNLTEYCKKLNQE